MGDTFYDTTLHIADGVVFKLKLLRLRLDQILLAKSSFYHTPSEKTQLS